MLKRRVGYTIKRLEIHMTYRGPTVQIAQYTQYRCKIKKHLSYLKRRAGCTIKKHTSSTDSYDIHMTYGGPFDLTRCSTLNHYRCKKQKYFSYHLIIKKICEITMRDKRMISYLVFIIHSRNEAMKKVKIFHKTPLSA